MPSREIRNGDTVLVLKGGQWVRGVAQAVYRDRYGVTGVVVDGVKYEVAKFKKR